MVPWNKTWNLINNILTSNLSCGCRSKPTDTIIIEPEPEPKRNPKTSSFNSKNHASSSNNKLYQKPNFNINNNDDKEGYTSTTVSININHNHHHHRYKCPKILSSVAIVKESNDPYEDFKQSMLEMILEKEMHSRNDLKQLIDCFLQLNSPHYHQVIVRAFMDIWNGDRSN